jgi:hypothetical protein
MARPAAEDTQIINLHAQLNSTNVKFAVNSQSFFSHRLICKSFAKLSNCSDYFNTTC